MKIAILGKPELFPAFSQEWLGLKIEQISNPAESVYYDYAISAWNSRILTPTEISLPKYGWINLHPSLLPYGRGRDPYYWSIVYNEPFGATIHWLTPEIDAGPIIFQREIPVAMFDTSKSLREKAIQQLNFMLEDVLYFISRGDKLPRREQNDDKDYPYPARRRQHMLDHRKQRELNPELIDLRYLLANVTCEQNSTTVTTKDGTYKLTLNVERA